jgi:hypothetical protein
MSEWSVEPKKLLEVLGVLDLVPCRPGIPSSVFIQFDERKEKLLACLSSDISGVVSIAGQGELGLKKPFHLDRRLFLPFVQAAKTYKSEKPFVFKKVDKQILVQQGRRKASFDIVAATAGYGEQNYSGGTVLPITGKLPGMFKVASECATPDPTVPELNCVYAARNAEGLDLYGSNQLVVFRGVHKVKGRFPDRLAFPLFLIPFLTSDGLKEVRLKEKEVVLQFGCGALWQGVSVKAQKGFPRKTMDELVADGQKWPEQFRLQTRRLGLVTARFTQYLTSVRRQDWLMHVSGVEGEKQILFEVKIPQGIFRERVAVEEPVKAAFEADWPLDILLPVFEYLYTLKEAVLRVRFGKKTPYLLTSSGVSIVVSQRK